MKWDTLDRKIKKLPRNPGIYIFQNSSRKPIYIGKALNLRDRVSNYLKIEDSRIIKMIESAKNLKYQETNSDIEALILESRLIKKFKPQFNIVMRDDKQYFYVEFTNEQFPKIRLTHQPYKIQNAEFIGPFTDGNILKSTLCFLRKIFPYCACRQKHNNYCLNYHVGNCLGFCCLKNKRPTTYDLQLYNKDIRAIKEILTGKRISLIKKLEKEKRNLAKKGSLEKAIKLRDRIFKLERIFENARIIRNSQFEMRDSKEILEKLMRILRLPKLPSRIEAYDISNIQGQNATGSMVVFRNGEADKNEYRKFKIRTKDSPDDTAMLKEVLSRRLTHPEWHFPDLIIIDGGKGQLNAAQRVIRNSKYAIPLISLTKDKNHRGSHIFIANKKDPIHLNNLPNSLKNLILAVDSEAHRFAINYYRKLHIKSMTLNI